MQDVVRALSITLLVSPRAANLASKRHAERALGRVPETASPSSTLAHRVRREMNIVHRQGDKHHAQRLTWLTTVCARLGGIQKTDFGTVLALSTILIAKGRSHDQRTAGFRSRALVLAHTNPAGSLLQRNALLQRKPG